MPDWFSQNAPTKDWFADNSPENKSFASSAWEKLTTPLVNFVDEEGHKRFVEQAQPGLNDSKLSAQAKGFLSGATEAGLNTLSSLTSPLNIGLSGLGYATKVAQSLGLLKLARTLQAPSLTAGAGMVGHGAYTAYNEPDWGKKAGGLAETAIGLGILHQPIQLDPVNNPALPKQIKLLPERTEQPSPKFIAGAAGIAENRPYNVDMGPVNPSPGLIGSGTILPREYGEVNQIPPDLAARRGLNVGQPVQVPQELADSFVNKYQPTGQLALPSAPNRLTLPPRPTTNFIYDEKKGNIPQDRMLDIPTPEKYKNPDKIQLKQSDIEPSFMRAGEGRAKIGVNVKRSAEELTTGYSTYLPSIMAREGLQNAFDAVDHLGDKGNVNIHYNDSGPLPFLEITDNGKGMSPQELETVYTNLHESGKTTDTGAAGGKGVGKASYMLGGSHFEVETVKDINGKKIKSSFFGTPDELMEGFDVKTEEVPSTTPTGTRFRTVLKPSQTESWMTRGFIRDIMVNSRNRPYKVTGNIGYGDTTWEIPNKTQDKVVTKTPIDNGSSELELSIPQGTDIQKRSSIKLHVLNKGMFQFSKPMYLNEEVGGIPAILTVDITPKVEEGDSNYPFPVQRESLKESTLDEIERIIKREIVTPMGDKRKIDLKKLWDAMPIIENKGSSTRQFTLFDSGNRLNQDELDEFLTNPVMNTLSTHIDDMLNSILSSQKSIKYLTKVERVGLVLDPNMHGVHIPNPIDPRNKSAILFNPFITMSRDNPADAALNIVVTGLHEAAHVDDNNPSSFSRIEPHDLNDPRVGKFMQSFLEQTVEQGGIDLGHGIAFLHRLANIYAKFGTRKAMKYVDRIESAITDPKTGGYNAEIQKLLSIYEESRGREATTEDILSGTGVKSTAKRRPGKKRVPSNDSTNGTGVSTEQAVGKLINAMRSGKAARLQQDVLYHEERKARAQDIGKVKTRGLAGHYQKLGMLKGELPKVSLRDDLLNQEEVDSLINSIHDSTLQEYEKINAGEGLLNILKGVTPKHYELKLLKQVFGDDFSNATIEMFGGIGQGIFKDVTARQLINESVNLPKSFMAAVDLSAPLRQGLPFILKRAYWKSFNNMFKMAGSQEAYDGVMKSIYDRPLYNMGEVMGLKLTDIGTNLAQREEAFLSRWAETGDFLRDPTLKKAYQSTIGGIVKASDRAYVGFLNKLRADVFDDLIRKAQASGELTQKLGMDIANFVNVSTGRGSLGRYERIAVDLNAALFSPRMIASRLTMLNPLYYIKETNPMLRKEKLKALLSVAGFGLIVAGLGKLNGAEVNLDPTNSDFMKIKSGNTRFDPYAGFQQYIVAAARLLTGKTTSSVSGKIKEFNQGYNAPTRIDEIGRFMRNKESPALSFAHDIIKGTDWRGAPVDVKNALITRFTPLLLQDLYDISQSDPNILPAAALAGTFGVGVQNYSPAPPKFQRTLRLH